MNQTQLLLIFNPSFHFQYCALTVQFVPCNIVSIEKAGRRNTVYCEMKIQMLLLSIFFLNFLLVELSSASKRLKGQTPTIERKLVGMAWQVTKLVASPCLFVHCSIPTGKCCNASVAREGNIKLRRLTSSWECLNFLHSFR